MLKILGLILIGISIFFFTIAILNSWFISAELTKMQIQYLKENWSFIVGAFISFAGGIILMRFSE